MSMQELDAPPREIAQLWRNSIEAHRDAGDHEQAGKLARELSVYLERLPRAEREAFSDGEWAVLRSTAETTADETEEVMI